VPKFGNRDRRTAAGPARTGAPLSRSNWASDEATTAS